MAQREESDPIGFDPVRWVERLLDVVDGSSFHADDIVHIHQSLEDLRKRLILKEGLRGIEK